MYNIVGEKKLNGMELEWVENTSRSIVYVHVLDKRVEEKDLLDIKGFT